MVRVKIKYKLPKKKKKKRARPRYYDEFERAAQDIENSVRGGFRGTIGEY